MRKIGIDRRDPSFRHFYYDDSTVLTSNPPKYKIWYVDDETDIDYIECNKVVFIKNSPVEEKSPNITIDTNIVNNDNIETEDKKSDTLIKIDSNHDGNTDITINTNSKNVKDVITNVLPKAENKKKGRKKKEDNSTIVEPKQVSANIDLSEIKELIKSDKNHKFEYKIFEIDFSSTTELNELLNNYGQENWELCSCELYNSGLIFDKKKILCIMKRKKSDI